MDIVDRIDLHDNQLTAVCELVGRFLPGTRVWAFGSRVRFTAHAGSDLDLVVFTRNDETAKISSLREAFEESDLPCRVDLLEWHAIPDEFKKNIQSGPIFIIYPLTPP